MDEPQPTSDARRGRVLIPLDAEAALRALMSFQHSREPGGAPAATGEPRARS